MKTLATTLAVVLVALMVPAFASAETFTVDTIEDGSDVFGCTNPSTLCSLRDAINRSNENGAEKDTIVFSGVIEGTIVLQSSLPQIEHPALVDGTTATGYAGSPVVQVDATQAVPEYGLDVRSGGTEIRGLSITGGPGPALHFAVGAESKACGNYLGVDPAGAEASSGAGILIGENAERTAVGGLGCGNLISGNEGPGIVDEGFDTTIVGNLIGTDASGKAPLPNGGPGIETTANASSTGITNSGGVANTIAFNEGPGVAVGDAETIVAIYGNSIFANDGLGIQVLSGVAPSPPVLTLARSKPSSSVSGTFAGEPNKLYYVDLYANEKCDPSGSGEGQTYLKDVEVFTNGSGLGSFDAKEEGKEEGEEGILPIPAGQGVITATVSVSLGEGGESTSEFSKCLTVQNEEATPPPPAPPLEELTPENGETLAVEPVSGTVYVKLPGQKKQVKLTEGMLIPVGSIVDATKGKVTLTSANKAGETQTAVFFGGRFLVAQRDGSGLVTLKLRGGNFKGCKQASGSSAAASAARKGRRLWGSGKGRFRTEGNHGSATVRGTIWLTEDRCNATFFKVRQGVVTIRDFDNNETFPLGKGKSYLARP